MWPVACSKITFLQSMDFSQCSSLNMKIQSFEKGSKCNSSESLTWFGCFLFHSFNKHSRLLSVYCAIHPISNEIPFFKTNTGFQIQWKTLQNLLIGAQECNSMSRLSHLRYLMTGKVSFTQNWNYMYMPEHSFKLQIMINN